SSVTAWRDNYLQGNQVFSEEIERKLQHSGALIPVLSPRYLKSDWCLRELGAFVRNLGHNGGLKTGTKSRVFKVVKTPVDVKEQPAVMQNVLGYEFYVLDDRGRPKELPDRDPAPDAEKRYLARVDDLAYDLHLLLKDLKAGEDHAPANPAPGEAVPPTTPGATPPARIYLAETTR